MGNDLYTIEWSIQIEAESLEDAALQAWGIMDDASSHNFGATVISVQNDITGETTVYDMEELINQKKEEGNGA
jgi:hypothetical protein